MSDNKSMTTGPLFCLLWVRMSPSKSRTRIIHLQRAGLSLLVAGLICRTSDSLVSFPIRKTRIASMAGPRRYDRDSDSSDSYPSRGHPRPRVRRESPSYEDEYHHKRRPRRGRHYTDYDEDDDVEYGSPPPRTRTRTSEGRHRHRPRSRSRGAHEDESRQRKEQAIKSALTAGAVEALRQRNRSGEWVGEKGLRVATAAISAAAIDSAVDKNPRKKGKRNIIASSLGGLVVDKLASGIRGTD